MDRIFPDGINGFHQLTAHFAVKQAGEQDGLVERRFHQNGFAFHIAVLLDVMDDLLHESDLLCIQRFIVDELGECLHGGFVVELRHLAHQQTKRGIFELPGIIFFAAQLAGEDVFQLNVIAL